MNNHIETLVFDLGGVLLNLNKQACIDAFKSLGFENVELYLNEYEQRGLFGQLEDGSLSAEQFHLAVQEILGSHVTTAQIDAAFNSFLQDIPEYKLDMLSELKQQYNILMLSNTNGIMFDHICQGEFSKQQLCVHDYFDELYLSYQMGCAKPNAEIFEQMIAQSGLNPARTLYLDDAPRNIEASLPFGFQTLLVEPREDFRSKLAQQLCK